MHTENVYILQVAVASRLKMSDGTWENLPVLNLLYGPFSFTCLLPDQKGKPLSRHLQEQTWHLFVNSFMNLFHQTVKIHCAQLFYQSSLLCFMPYRSPEPQHEKKWWSRLLPLEFFSLKKMFLPKLFSTFFLFQNFFIFIFKNMFFFCLQFFSFFFLKRKK